jgi:hypothetical protein
MRRIVERGFLRVTGDCAFEPIEIASLLGGQSGQACTHAKAGNVAALLTSGARFVSVDATCDADLDTIAATLLPLGHRILWAGSAGLAAALARLLEHASNHPLPDPITVGVSPLSFASTPQLALERTRVTDRPLPAHAQTGDAFASSRRTDVPSEASAPRATLFAIGSDHRMTLAQQDALLSARPSILLDSAAATRGEITGALARGQHVLLRVPRGKVTMVQMRALLAGAPAAALVLSGGDTASLVCHALGVKSIELHDEVVSGVPLGVFRGGDFDGGSVATKSGGFGDRDTLVQVADFFHARSER